MTGLLQALSLKRQGFDVTVLERDLCDQRSGHESGIQIGPTFLELLKKHDKTGQQITVPVDGVCWAWKNKSGSRKISPGKDSESNGQRQMANWTALYQLLRANFDGLASATVPTPPEDNPETDGHAEYRAGKLVTGITYEYGKVRVTFTDVETNKMETLVDGNGSCRRWHAFRCSGTHESSSPNRGSHLSCLERIRVCGAHQYGCC